MTENVSPADEAADIPPQQMSDIVPVVPLHQVPDVNLLAIAHIADFVGFPLTLYMPWGIAAGNVGSPNGYYKHLGEQVRAGIIPADAPEGWREMIDEFASTNFDAYSEMTPSERLENSYAQGFDLLSHINLRDATCWVGGFTHPMKHEYLRVRLSDVSAWAWGAATARD